MIDKRIDQFLEVKRKSESQLYTSCILVLNEKKQYIQYLCDLLDKCDSLKTIRNANPYLETTKNIGEKLDQLNKPDVLESTSRDSNNYSRIGCQNNGVTPLNSTNYDPLSFCNQSISSPGLPKRQKMKDSNVINKHSVIMKDKVAHEEQPNVSSANTYNADCSSLTFGTQDILDKM